MNLRPNSVLNAHNTNQPEAPRVPQEIYVPQCPDEFSYCHMTFSSLSGVFSPFIHCDVQSLPSRTARRDWQGSKTTCQHRRQWGGDSAEALCACSVLQQCSLTTFREANLVFDIECVHSSCSSLFWRKGQHVLLWTWKCEAALQKLITQGTESLWSEDYLRFSLRRRLAIL